MNRVVSGRLSAVFFALLVLSARSGAQAVPEHAYSGMVWRSVGPFRGGRVSAVTGAIGSPGIFYIGLPLGGVWKTTSAGATWTPIFDSVREASSVGAIQAAPSDPNTLYVGMGDMVVGGGINRGNGVYKSTDGGNTWVHIGLEKTEHIPCILVDPHDPNIVMVAAQGPTIAKSDDRGLYRSTDGGRNWKKTLATDNETGVQRMAWAYDHPNVMLATTMHYYNAPGPFRVPGGPPAGTPPGTPPGPPPGPGRRAQNAGGIFKSTDEGVTWTELNGGSLPRIMGRTSVAVAMHTNSQRMYLVGNFGLYRSDDGGASWRQMDAADRRVSNGQGGYNCGVYVDSQNPDIVYVVNTCCYRSTDGGKTFTGFKGAPGGDDPQQLWIDPTDGRRMLFGTDQGATVSLDAGQSWSSWYNQATAQVYHISVDNQYPYWIYGTQQDSGSIATSSRGNLGAITPLDWLPHPGYEFGSIVADPLNPKVSYAGGPSGGIVKTTYPSGQWINVSPNMDSAAALRKVGNQPLVFSRADPHELLAGFQYLMSTTDGGRRWRRLSPDLTLKPGEAPPARTPATPGKAAVKPRIPGPKPRGGAAAAPPGTGLTPAAKQTAPAGAGAADSGAEMAANADADTTDTGDKDAGVEEQDAQRPGGGGAIESISTSPLNRGILWAGTSNGLIKLSTDHGETWADVTIPDMPIPARADIVAIDAAPRDPATAYVAVDLHGVGDYRPYLYRTHDYGRSWTAIVSGLPQEQTGGSFARVIRADTVRQGLLFAGTESAVYVSFDDGDHWSSLALNLPNTSYRDMVVKGNDLVVGTYGRSFWILDDIAPLRQLAPGRSTEPMHLFKPSDAIRVRRNVNGDTPFPPEIPHAENAPAGAILYYSLDTRPVGDISIDIHDARGRLVRHMTSAVPAPSTEPPPPVPDFWVEKPTPLPAEAGLNRTNWNLRYDSPQAFSHSYEINANPGETPPSPEGPLALPGVYTITLTVGGRSSRQLLVVRNDPRSPASATDLREQSALQSALLHCSQESWDGFRQVSDVRAAVAALIRTSPAADVVTAARALDVKLSAIGGSTGFGRRFGGFGGPGAVAPPPSFTGVNGASTREINELDSGDMAPTEAMRKSCLHVSADMEKVSKAWAALAAKDLVAFNALLVKSALKPIPDPIPARSIDPPRH